MARVRYQRRVKAAPHVAGIATAINTVLPVITGDTAGEDCTTSNGTWTNSSSFTYQWYLDGVLLAGETASTITTDETWAGQTLTVVVYGGNGAGKIGATSLGVELQAGGYDAPAVTFSNQDFLSAAFIPASTPLLSFSFWANVPDLTNYAFFFEQTPGQTSVSTGFNFAKTDVVLFALGGDGQVTQGTNDNTLTENAWHHFAGAMDTNHPTGEKIMTLYLDRVSVLNPTYNTDSSSGAFNLTHDMDGMHIPGGYPGEGVPFSTCDFQIYYGQFIDFSNVNNLNKFVDINVKPVSPSVATAAFGQPTILLSGDNLSFSINQGSAGTFSLTTTGYSHLGNNGPGSVPCAPGVTLTIGMVVASVYNDTAMEDVTSSFEHVISVLNAVQQTSASDLSMDSLTFKVVHPLTNASSSPSD